MSIRFYMDVHIPLAVTEGLRRRGVDVLTSQEDGTTKMDDPDSLDRATGLGRVIYTQDVDFLAEANNRQQAGIPFAGVIYSPQLGITVGQSVNDLELIAKVNEPKDMANLVLYIPFKNP